jgi:hypothetical protein
MPRRRAPGTARRNSNLNAVVRGARPPYTGSPTACMVCFRPEHILAHLRRHLLRAPYVVACVAWVSAPELLDALARCRGVSLIVNYDRTLLRKHRDAYSRLTPMPGNTSAVRYVRGGGRALMHHKFCVLLVRARARLPPHTTTNHSPLSPPSQDEDKVPTGDVFTGSFNYTRNSKNNLEHIIHLQGDPGLAARFMREHLTLLQTATPMRRPRASRRRT